MKAHRFIAAGAFLALSALVSPSRAQDADETGAGPMVFAPPPTNQVQTQTPQQQTTRVRLRYNLALDLTATGAMAATLFTWGAFLKPTGDIGSKSCTICDGPGTELNGLDDFFRRNFKHDDTTPAATVSHVLSYGVAPLGGIALTLGMSAYDHRFDEAPLNVLIVVEASLSAVILKEALSLAIRRERPAVHALEGEEKRKALNEGDPLESFPSGHLASELAIMTAIGTVASMRGYRLAPLVWIVGGVLGGVIAYTRIAADQHYFTDNLAGAAIGIGMGAGVPLLFHRPVESSSRPPVALRWLQGATLTSQEVQRGRTFALSWLF